MMRDIGSRVEMFVDEWLIERMRGVRVQIQPPQRREIVLTADTTFECATACYFNLFEDEGRIRLYYRGYVSRQGSDDDRGQTANLAESTDGVRFDKPNWGLFEVGGSRANNAVWQGVEAHNLFVFRDDNPRCRPEERYKAVGGHWEHLFGLVSPDGVRWRKMREEPLAVNGTFDSLNVVFWDGGMDCYRMFSRFFDGHVRAIQHATSDDFIHWNAQTPFSYQDDLPMQYYTNATLPCPGAEHILLAFPMRFVPEREKDTAGMDYPGSGISDAVFMASRDGLRWRRFHEAWLRPNAERENWTHRSNMPARGIVAGAHEWSMYISEHYGWPGSRLRRLAVRPFGFASLHADYRGGDVVTHPLTFTGRRLLLNYATSAVGSLAVEVQDAQGRALPGYRLRDAVALYGNELHAVAMWKGDRDLAALRGRPVRLRFRLADADLFALQVAE